jgi:hypothetical protein
MRALKYWLCAVFGLLLFLPAEAHINPELHNKPNVDVNTQVKHREDCLVPKEQIDQGPNRLTGGRINNVRARLRTGGDPWWDGQNGKYVVPYVDPGEAEISSIFAGGVWLGGIDPGNNLKVACQTYGNPNGSTDFFTGPLDPIEGGTDQEICENWDRFFEVYASEIDDHLAMYNEAQAGGDAYTEDMIPRGVKGWPAKGNEYFFEINEFDLPNTTQGLAGFFDRNGDTNYDPLDGDYPVIEIRGCEAPNYPDQMIFWIYNDNGGIHGETMGNAIQMEVQVQAFAYGTNDQINDMTFQRYKLINRAIEDIDSTYFAMWVDPDLGCYTDDYVGCDTTRSLAYTYNADALDGQSGCQCPGVAATYCNNIPIVGVDYFRGPLRPVFADTANTIIDTLIEIGMSSFTYYNNGGVGQPPPGTTDPQTAAQFYNYLTGTWLDGTPFTFGDDAYADGDPVKYAFVDEPNNPNGWSMCSAGTNPNFDRRTIQASGPFLLKPGAVNELIVGVVWVPEFDYPCPDISRLFAADDLAQNLFDNCFAITNGPDAPDVDLIELDRELVMVLTNDTLSSNNAFEQYEELDLQFTGQPGDDSTYNFEGYLLYQLADANVSRGDFDDPSKARLVVNVDVKNGVSEIYNWTSIKEPFSEEVIWVPEIQVAGLDEGIRHTFQVTQDQFASGDSRLINHKRYYFTAIAYAYNNWAQYDPDIDIGQRRPYLEGRRNIKTYTAIPRPIVDRDLNSNFGDGPIVTRIDGVGVGGNFVDISEESRRLALSGGGNGEVIYRPGEGPIEITVYNPLEVIDGEFELTFVDENMGNTELDTAVNWVLRNLSDPGQPVINSSKTIDALNEQVIADYGFTVAIAQTDDIGDNVDDTNGVIGYEEEYGDPNLPAWLSGVPDEANGRAELNYIATATDEPDFDLDPNRAFSSIGPGYFAPYQIIDHRSRPEGSEYITPGWRDQNGGLYKDGDILARVNNVDIYFSTNPDEWSRCVVVETSSRYYDQAGFPSEGGRRQFELRAQPSVGKTDGNGDGRPDADGSGTEGMGWFPGYAIDVETGKRLNIFFGENSSYDCSLFCDNYDNGVTTANDMLFNPSSQLFLQTGGFTEFFNFLGGGQHFIYVTNTEYDECAEIYEDLSGYTFNNNLPGLLSVLRSITWAGWPMLEQSVAFNSVNDGLVPNDLAVKLRVDNPYAVETGTGEFNGYPTYRFKLEGLAATALDNAGVENALDMINVVPNPYYAFSSYEPNQFNTIVKITNLPAKCTVRIYSLDGKFIRQYDRDETGVVPDGVSRGIKLGQYVPDIEWDLKNGVGVPIAAGVYLIHIEAPGLGERTIKWFGTNRQFDPSGL